MVFALALEDSWKSIFILYFATPLFIFFLVYTLALRASAIPNYGSGK
jgi:hypothetical protein